MYGLSVSRRRAKQRTAKTHGQAPRLAEVEPAAFAVVRRATRVERLAYTRTQAAQALGVSRSTFTRRVLPLIETQIQAAHGAGKTLAQIARDLNTARIPTAHGGARWWPSTVRAVVDRVSA